MKALIIIGKCEIKLRDLAEASVDAIVTDPPYGLEFMGKDWDAPWKTDRRQGFDGSRFDLRKNPYGGTGVRNGTGASYGADARIMQEFQKWCEVWAAECLRVLKPGGYLLSFGGSRTYHRMASAVEDAGFEIRDQIMWLYGSGFPKSLDVSKAIDKAAGVEREVVATSPSGGYKRLMTHNAEDGFRPADYYPEGNKFTSKEALTDAAKQWQGWGTALKPAHEPIVVARKPLIGTVAANVLAHGTGALNIDGCRVEGVKDVPSSPRRAKQGPAYGDLSNDPGMGGGFNPNVGRWPANVIHDGSDEVLDEFAKFGDKSSSRAGGNPNNPIHGTNESRTSYEWGKIGRLSIDHRDEGTAARFFYTAKADKQERESGLYDLNANKSRANIHPTVKPVDLMGYLCRLVTPPGGTVLDPFTGSGSTGVAALREGFDFIGIEEKAEYAGLAERRMKEAVPLFAEVLLVQTVLPKEEYEAESGTT